MLAERHRARLAMQEGEVAARTETRRGHRVARRLFQDQDQDDDQDRDQNHDQNNEVGSNTTRPYAGVEDNLTNRLSEEARKDLATAENRWNFDFRNERPLPGRWDWVKVGEGRKKEGENLSGNEEDDWDEDNTDQREKSETEANEKTNNKMAMTGGKD